MNYTLTYKTKQFFFVLIKLSLVSVAFYFIYLKLKENTSINSFPFSFKCNFSIQSILMLISLSAINWYLEILKWKTLVSSIKKISLSQALDQCLGALTISLITPNKIGEYGAKAIYYSSSYRKHILLINLISNMLQLFITVSLGAIGLLLFTSKHYLALDYKNIALIITSIIGVTIILLMFLWNTNLNIKGLSLKKIKQFVITFSKKKLAISLLFSLLRYIIFSFQFYYLLILFKIEIPYLTAMEVITSIYLIASIIPAISIFDIFIKGSIAVFLFSFYGFNELTILSITTLMWILNFVLPSIVGSYYVLRFNIAKKIE